MKINKKTKGESLLEGIIAFTILGIGIAFAGVIMGTSIRNMDNSKNRIIAINAAREGIEAVRNIRDTNWLKYSTNRRSCWNHLPQKDPASGCDGNKPIKPGKYIIYKQGDYPNMPQPSFPTNRWRLELLNTTGGAQLEFPTQTSQEGDIFYNHINTYGFKNGKWIDTRTLYMVDINHGVDSDNSDGANNKTNDQDILNHIFSTDKDIYGEAVRQTALKREIIIEYLSDSGTPTNGTTTSNRMRVTSKVTWLKGDKEFKVELITHLTDYLGREKL